MVGQGSPMESAQGQLHDVECSVVTSGGLLSPIGCGGQSAWCDVYSIQISYRETPESCLQENTEGHTGVVVTNMGT